MARRAQKVAPMPMPAFAAVLRESDELVFEELEEEVPELIVNMVYADFGEECERTGRLG